MTIPVGSSGQVEPVEKGPLTGLTERFPRPDSNALYASEKKLVQKIRDAISAPFFRNARKVLPDGLLLRLLHLRNVGRLPNLANPKTFNEIILHRCLYPESRWTNLTDKLLVREYVESKVGKAHLIPLLAAPDVFTQEVFDSLPKAFVMKANHGCGFVKVVRDKSLTSFQELDRLAKKWLETDFYRATREKHYEPIHRRIFFEQLLLDKTGRVPADFKLNVFGPGPNGPIIYTGVITDRFGEPRHDFYDPDWTRLDVVLGHYPCSAQAAPPLPNWDEVVGVATRLADGLGYVRVDLYVLDDKIYFGELTFTPGGGLMRISPDRYDLEWGRLIQQMK
jgi:hypothetical protein